MFDIPVYLLFRLICFAMFACKCDISLWSETRREWVVLFINMKIRLCRERCQYLKTKCVYWQLSRVHANLGIYFCMWVCIGLCVIFLLALPAFTALLQWHFNICSAARYIKWTRCSSSALSWFARFAVCITPTRRLKLPVERWSLSASALS